MDRRNIPVTAETLGLLQEIDVPTLSGTLTQAMGYRNNYMMGVKPLAVQLSQRMVGRARTLRFIPLCEDLVAAQYELSMTRPHRDALEEIEPGEVLVIDAGGCLEAAVIGDMFTRRVHARGGSGIVIDGVLRDLSAIRTVGLPVFAKGMHGSGISRALMSVGRDQPIGCGDIPVIPGDIIVGDIDGVVVIPPHIAEETAKRCYEHRAEEEWARIKLAEGASIHDVYPPSGAFREEFEAWLSSHRKGRMK